LKSNGFGQGVLKGMWITLKNLLRRPITLQYPEETLEMSKRIRGNEILWYPGKCTACSTCAKGCPQGNIEIVTKAGPDNKRVVEKFEIDTGRCTFCGLCVEACPYDALFMGRAYERARYRRKELVTGTETIQFSEERQPSGYYRPGVEKFLPQQSMLILWDKDKAHGGQKLQILPLRRLKIKGTKSKK